MAATKAGAGAGASEEAETEGERSTEETETAAMTRPGQAGQLVVAVVEGAGAVASVQTCE